MGYKLIYGDIEDKILFNSYIQELCCFDNENLKFGNKVKRYYKLGSNKIEIVKFNFLNDNVHNLVLSSKDKNILIVDDVNEKNVLIIDELCKKNNVIVISIKNSTKDIKNKLSIKALNNLIIIKDNDFNNAKLNIDSILMYILDCKSELANTEKEKYLISDYEEGIDCLGKVALKILKSCADIYYYQNLDINLYCNKEFNLDELINIEDVIKEYMNENATLIIRQITNDYIKDKIHFSVLTN
ncbi:MAG: hypothetical protein ACRC92_17835 [Peptostreptococcaceae bacterium]